MIRLAQLAFHVLLAGCARPAGAAAWLIADVTVIDGRGGPPAPPRDVLVEGVRIVAVMPAGGAAPAGAQRIDGRGRYLIPGLIDSHVHLKSRPRDPGVIEQILALVALRSGVTTVRDMGGNGEAVRALAEAARRPGAHSPEILYAALMTGPASDFWPDGELARLVTPEGAPGSRPWFRHFRDGSGLEQAVRDARAFGAAGIKLHSGFTADEVARIGAEARRQGLALWTHAFIGPARPGDAVAAGAATLSHADMLAYEGAPPALPAMGTVYRQQTERAMAATPVGGAVIGRLLAAMKANGTCLEPTLMVMRGGAVTPGREAYLAYAAAIVARAHRKGVAICAGTDGIGGSTANLPEEMKLLVERAGLSPLAAIRAATWDNARALRLGDRGLVAPGRRADLVLLAADPAADIANLRRVAGVMIRGVWHPARATR
jgi:imidazolonepropionase-like amidohydrolase